MEDIKNNDFVLYKGVVGKVELVLGETVIANIEGLKIKNHISEFKKWDKDKVNNISKDKFTNTSNKILDKDYLVNKYPNFDESDIEILLTSGVLIIQNLKEELFGGKYAENDVNM